MIRSAATKLTRSGSRPAWAAASAISERIPDPVVAGIATRIGRTPSQVVLAWHLQRGNVVFPKSTHRDRIAENLAATAIDLDAADLAAVDALNRDERSGSHPDHVEWP